MSRLIQAQGISKIIGNITLLDSIDFTVCAKDFIVILGQSGSGKSTLLHILAGLDQPTSGFLYWQDQDILTLSGNALNTLRNTQGGFVYQFHHLLPEFSALENILLPLWIAHKSKDQGLEKAYTLLALVGLAHRAHHTLGALSGGERQRVALARALANDPLWVLADEPTGNLDTKNANHVWDILLEVQQRLGLGVVAVTHDLTIAHFAKKIYYLNAGKLTH
jgi:lipoprotein-releasing system ATP-binding protein